MDDESNADDLKPFTLPPLLARWRVVLYDVWHLLIRLEEAIDTTPPGSPQRRAAFDELGAAQHELATAWAHYRENSPDA